MKLALHAALTALCGSALLLAGAGCDTQAFCFDDCEDGTGTNTGTNTGAGGAGGAGAGVTVTGVGGNESITVAVSTGSGAGGCEVTNPEELCDGIDNDCNGEVDDAIDFGDPRQCGNCDTNCFQLLVNVDPETITCEPGEPGEPGSCDGDCAADYYDRDGDGSCEAYCVSAADDDETCDNKDDDCDGSLDEDVDLCTDRTNCGICGRQCEAANAVTSCVADDGVQDCDESNTECRITGCSAGFVDANGLYLDGCELPCVPTNGGVEICGDQIDNDCDGAIDSADSDLSGDPNVGAVCFGGQQTPASPVPPGVCGAAGNEGTWACQGTGYTCVGPNVVEPGELVEMCNGEDDNCNGVDDEGAVDVGDACGESEFVPCRLGTIQCVDGAATCIGAILPGVEVCNGVDDDCDGDIDRRNNGMMPADSVGACNVPPAAPPGGTTPCMAGTLTCAPGGVVDCVGDVGPQAPADTCGVDQNCNGELENQPLLMTDVRNCGACGNDCYESGAENSIQSCADGMCVFEGCQFGYLDGPGAGPCDLACIPTPEVCDGEDNDCDGVADNNVVLPPASQVCGVSPSATRPECTTGVTVECQNGAFVCDFPNNVCAGGCTPDDEVCDALDNDCDGTVNENVPNWGDACASDDGEPAPGDGVCRRTGQFVCSGANATVCSVANNPLSCDDVGDCVELCDGEDNDCDGSVDEPYSDPGANPTYYYQPDVVRIGGSQWIMAYEASRPSATAPGNPQVPLSPGSGNGYWTSAPPGETLDRTPACSVPERLPWFNVTPQEVEQTCEAMGGHVCSYTGEWRRGCRVPPGDGADCTWGYAPDGTACRSTFTGSKYCNIGPAFDFDPDTAGDQDGLLLTGELAGENCFADWRGLQAGAGDVETIFDMTGNLREIVLDGGTFRVVGGAFNTQAESGATCNFSFYSVAETFKFFDTGFRCCFDEDPT